MGVEVTLGAKDSIDDERGDGNETPSCASPIGASGAEVITTDAAVAVTNTGGASSYTVTMTGLTR